MSQWSSIKKELLQQNNETLVKLIGDLYGLSKENKNFIEARFANEDGDVLKTYKILVEKTFDLGVNCNKPLKLSKGRKAISDYIKATNNILGELELKLLFVERGNNFTMEYGDIDEVFYNSIESMFDSFKKSLITYSQYKDVFKKRIFQLKINSDGVGWGYSDYMSQTIEELITKIY